MTNRNNSRQISILTKALDARIEQKKELMAQNNKLVIEGGKWRNRLTGRFLGEKAKDEAKARVDHIQKLSEEIADIALKLDILKDGGTLSKKTSKKDKSHIKARSQADYQARQQMQRNKK